MYHNATIMCTSCTIAPPYYVPCTTARSFTPPHVLAMLPVARQGLCQCSWYMHLYYLIHASLLTMHLCWWCISTMHTYISTAAVCEGWLAIVIPRPPPTVRHYTSSHFVDSCYQLEKYINISTRVLEYLYYTVGADKNGTPDFVHYSAQDASILIFSVAIM